MSLPRKYMSVFAIDTAAKGEFLTHDDDTPTNPIGNVQAAKHKCAYNQHIDAAPDALKPIPRRTILIARAYNRSSRRSERVAEALLGLGYKTLGDLMHKTQSELSAELNLDATHVREFAAGLKRHHFYLAD
ncbi:hypothetical protein [Sulfitobacter pacificus]|uniref:hypothetical protein n=1 Tax=Sulfitobacter pacificus TaxID=1499314 RepID=UPI00310C630A